MIKSYSSILLILFLFAFIPIASAVEAEYTFKQNTLIDIKRPCINAGTWCSSSAVCNITITQPPNNTAIVDNARMTNQVSYHNKTLFPNQVLALGQYKADMTCTDSGLSGSETFFFDITPSGDKGILGLNIILILLIYGITLVGFFGKNEWVTIFGGLALMPLGLYMLLSGVDVYRNFMTNAIALITIGIGSFVSITAAISIIEENIK